MYCVLLDIESIHVQKHTIKLCSTFGSGKMEVQRVVKCFDCFYFSGLFLVDDYVLVAKDKHGYNVEQVSTSHVCGILNSCLPYCLNKHPGCLVFFKCHVSPISMHVLITLKIKTKNVIFTIIILFLAMSN